MSCQYLNDSHDAANLPLPDCVDRMYFGGSERMLELRRLTRRVGPTTLPVLIQGETGTGKEVLAKELHAASDRAKRPFIKINCAAMPADLIESELFGYEKGAFTGAMQRKAGLFELAHNGTLLLDEIGDMDLRLQAKLLHVVQDCRVRRVGGHESIPVDVRLITATHRDLEKAILANTFREDLYYRINVVGLNLPALRDRLDDIVSLAKILLARHQDDGQVAPPLTQAICEGLRQHDWPGNVRELENVLRRYSVFRDSDLLLKDIGRIRERSRTTNVAPIGPVLLSRTSEPVSSYAQLSRARDKAEVDVILAALNNHRWNRKAAARSLQMEYKAFLYRVKKLGIESRRANVPAANGPAHPVSIPHVVGA